MSTKATKNMSNKEKQRLRSERAAAALREKQRRERRRQILTVSGVVLAIVLIVAGGFVINSLRDDTKEVAAGVPAPGSPHGLTIGSESADHTLVIYEDFLCPFCRELEQQTREPLVQLAEQGRVQVEYRPFVLLSRIGPYSERATVVWTVVRQLYGDDVAKEFHDLLFEHQPSEAGPFPSYEDLYELAAQAGADADELRTAVENGEGTDEVASATQSAEDLGVDSTPTIVLDGEPFTNGRTMDELAQNLLQALQ
jgi:protein-disulfide isomerase